MSVPFKVYANFECILKGVDSNAGSCTKNIKISFLVVFLTNLFVFKFSKPIILYRGENATYKYIEAILEEYEYCKKVIKIISTKI